MCARQNHDYEGRYEEWFLGGKLGRAPRCDTLLSATLSQPFVSPQMQADKPLSCRRYRYIAFHWWSLEWWGAMNYTIGVVGYNIAAITAVIYDCHEFGANAYVSGPSALTQTAPAWQAQCMP